MAEVYKIFKGEASAIMKNLFTFRENIHNIRNFQIIANKNKKQGDTGQKLYAIKLLILWASLPEESKHPNSVEKVKEKIKI